MNVVPTYPPNIKDIEKVIDLVRFPKAIFTYGTTIHNPGNGYIDEPLGIHEAQHSIQQDGAGGPKRWWKRWLSEPSFRLDQELEAYGLQYRRFCEMNADRNERARFLFTIASDLSSAQYGNVISLKEARERVRAFFSG